MELISNFFNTYLPNMSYGVTEIASSVSDRVKSCLKQINKENVSLKDMFQAPHEIKYGVALVSALAALGLFKRYAYPRIVAKCTQIYHSIYPKSSKLQPMNYAQERQLWQRVSRSDDGNDNVNLRGQIGNLLCALNAAKRVNIVLDEAAWRGEPWSSLVGGFSLLTEKVEDKTPSEWYSDFFLQPSAPNESVLDRKLRIWTAVGEKFGVSVARNLRIR